MAEETPAFAATLTKDEIEKSYSRLRSLVDTDDEDWTKAINGAWVYKVKHALREAKVDLDKVDDPTPINPALAAAVYLRAVSDSEDHDDAFVERIEKNYNVVMRQTIAILLDDMADGDQDDDEGPKIDEGDPRIVHGTIRVQR